MPKRNFGFEKRQKELEKQRKRAQKLQRRTERAADGQVEPEPDAPADSAHDAAPGADGLPAE